MDELEDRLKRTGKFRITSSLLREGNIDLLKKVMGKVVIIRAEEIFHLECVEYIAFSDSFEINEDAPFCSDVPLYDIVINDNDKEKIFLL